MSGDHRVGKTWKARTAPRWVRLVLLLVLDAVGTGPGCRPGAISDSAAGTPASPAPPASPPPPPGGAVADPGPSLMRRLTNDDYDRVLRTLFPQLPFQRPPSEALPVQGPWRDGLPEEEELVPVAAEGYLRAAADVAQGLSGAPIQALLQAGCPAGGQPAAAGGIAEDCARGLIVTLGKRAYRRPLLAEEIDVLMDAFRAGQALRDAESGAQAIVAAILQSPQFLYRAELGEPAPDRPPLWRPTSHEMAARLSFLVWGDLPDEALVSAADQGLLHTPEEVRAQLQRLINDPKAHPLALRFYRGWLPVLEDDGLLAGGIDSAPEFTPSIRADMQGELQRFVERHFWETDSALASLFTETRTFVTPALAAFYGATPPPGPDAALVALDPARRAGLLMQGALMAALAHSTRTSPVLRGEFVQSRILCLELPPPPPGLVAPYFNQPPPDATTRELLDIHASHPECAACHISIDAAGFLFENLDPAGRWRDTENGHPIDSSGALLQPALAHGQGFANAFEMQAFLATADETRDCTARHWFQFAMGRPADDRVDAQSLSQAMRGFAAGGYRLRDLVAHLTLTDAFLYRRPMRDQP